MKVIETNKHAYSNTNVFQMNEMEDDESTVSCFDDYISEMNARAPQRRSFASSTSNDDGDDDSTVSTVPSTNHDDDDDRTETSFDDLFDGLEYELDLDDDGCPVPKVKRVTFGTTTVREYGVTVGSCTPTNTGRCPMELTWEYAESYTIESNQNESMRNYPCRTRPLSVFERRDRIATVQGISTDDVLILEYEASIALIKETLEFLESSRHKFLYSVESPPRHNECGDRLSNQNKQIVGGSNKFLRKLMVEEISFNPL